MTAITNNKHYVFKSFQEKARTKSILQDLSQRRVRISDEPDFDTKAKIAVGSIAGTMIPLLYFAKKQNKNMKKLGQIISIKYGLKEMMAVSAGSIAGGVLTGIMFDKKNTIKEKTDEGVFQFLNASIPPAIVFGLLNLSKKHKKTNNTFVKLLCTAAGLISGMFVSSKLANLINDPKDKVPDRKLTIKDSVANIDDALGALVLAKISFVEKIHLDKTLPAIYAWCGYRAGESN